MGLWMWTHLGTHPERFKLGTCFFFFLWGANHFLAFVKLGGRFYFTAVIVISYVAHISVLGVKVLDSWIWGRSFNPGRGVHVSMEAEHKAPIYCAMPVHIESQMAEIILELSVQHLS